MVVPGVIVVEGDRMSHVNPTHLPEQAQVIDLGDLTLLPGMIDMHTPPAPNLIPDFLQRATSYGKGCSTCSRRSSATRPPWYLCFCSES